MSENADLASLLSHKHIEAWARASDLRYGRAIYERGGVAFIADERSYAEAWVGGLDGRVIEGGSQRRRTQLFATPEGLRWHCAGNPKAHQVFCKHCVALALTVLERDGR